VTRIGLLAAAIALAALDCGSSNAKPKDSSS
jgi:hypothetical protein